MDAERETFVAIDTPDRGASREFLQRPDVRRAIEEAKARIASGDVRRGKTAQQLRNAFREWERDRDRLDP
ncbi:MAG TPA: hypothetical protein VNN79_23835 [Actinomycetota bacterium]|nr:hypothetical protein [Actinomycetota bacterium]